MQRDLKIIFWLFIASFVIFIVYTVVDYSFALLDNPYSYTNYASVKTKFTSEPDNNDPAVVPDKNWTKGREPLPFLGYVHYSIIFLITGIFVITIVGFVILYLINKKE